MKILKYFVFILFIIICIFIFLWLIKTPITASYLSKKLKTGVVISKVSIASKQIILDQFKLINPKKTKSKYAFLAKKIQINYLLSKLFSSPLIIDSILLENVNLNIECKNPLCTKNNWTTIVNNVNEKEAKKNPKEIVIKKLVIKNMDVQITGLGLDFMKTKTTHIEEIELNNINSNKGFPTQQLITAIFRSSGLKDYLKGIMETKNMIENIIDTFKSVSENALKESIIDSER